MNDSQKKEAEKAQQHIYAGEHQKLMDAHRAQVAQNYPQHGQPNQK